MANNRDDKFEGTDESEYHFSDDEEVSYEVESETRPAAAPAPNKTNAASRFGSKRMMISFAVFLAIVFVVYKVISPSATPLPPTELAATPAQTNPAQTSLTRTIPVSAPKQQVSAAAKVQEAPLAQPAAVPQPSALASLPSMIPVQSAQPSEAQSRVEAMGAFIEDKSRNLNAASQQAIDNMQAQHSQQLNQFNEQNKALQNQVQSLNSRVADMEAQINQLVQVLTRRNSSARSASSSSSMNLAPAVEQARGPDARIAYNVQAIIPGRAWLKAENGETITVAEGDVIRGAGRVTKIDPYDGLVEINTGTKAVSLSYGNGG